MATRVFHAFRYPAFNFSARRFQATNKAPVADFFLELLADQLIDVLTAAWRISECAVTFETMLAVSSHSLAEFFTYE